MPFLSHHPTRHSASTVIYDTTAFKYGTRFIIIHSVVADIYPDIVPFRSSTAVLCLSQLTDIFKSDSCFFVNTDKFYILQPNYVPVGNIREFNTGDSKQFKMTNSCEINLMITIQLFYFYTIVSSLAILDMQPDQGWLQLSHGYDWENHV